MLQSRPAEQGLSLPAVLVAVCVLAIAAALMIPQWEASRRVSNEREAATALKTITSAEADFRANDRDGNGVNDFWTADLKGLHTMTRASIRGAGRVWDDPPIALIPLQVAAADADPTFHPAGGENVPLDRFSPSAPWRGHWFVALDADLSLAQEDADRVYRADTGGSPPMGRVHHPTKFGFVAVPDSPRQGKYVFMINENNSLFRRQVIDRAWTSPGYPPGLDALAPEFRNWPDDNTMKAYCCHAG